MSIFEPSLPKEEFAPTEGTDAPPAAVNTPTEDELLRSAKSAADAGLQSIRDAADALGTAQELHNTSQADMARAVGKSEAWVSMLLRWRLSGYKEESPFGPTTKAGRLKHAKERALSGASKARKPRQADSQAQADADDPEPSAAKRKAEYASPEAEADGATPSDDPAITKAARAASNTSKDMTQPMADADNAQLSGDNGMTETAGPEAKAATYAHTSSSPTPSPAKAKGELRYAIDSWWPHMDDAGKSEITTYFLKKAGVRAS
jgi:hypothetical protein